MFIQLSVCLSGCLSVCLSVLYLRVSEYLYISYSLLGIYTYRGVFVLNTSSIHVKNGKLPIITYTVYVCMCACECV